LSRKRKAYCIRGHERTPENLTASRTCRTCRRIMSDPRTSASVERFDRSPMPLKKCARRDCSNPVKGWYGRVVVRRIPRSAYSKRRYCSKRCAAKPKPCGWRREADEMSPNSRQCLTAIDGKKYGRRCGWSSCDALLIRKRVKSGEWESAANFNRRQHCDAEHASLAMRDRGLQKGIVAAMAKRAKIVAEQARR
jgi:hypothetical protein